MNYLYKSISTLPSYMKRNLENMPNNKGYIHNGTHFYGLKPPDGKNIIMFEKKGQILIIHKYYHNKIEIIHKNQITNKSKVIETKERINLFNL